MTKRRHDCISHDDEDESTSFDSSEQQCVASQQLPETSRRVRRAGPSERGKKYTKIDRVAQEIQLKSLSRMILFRGFEKEPIHRRKVTKDVGISGNDRYRSIAFQEASARLRNVFGFELNRIPKYMECMNGMAPKFKNRYFLLNAVKDTEQGNHSRAIHSVHKDKSIAKGFILLVNGLIFCKGESIANSAQKMLERDLYRYLHRMDPTIPEDPPPQGTTRTSRKRFKNRARAKRKKSSRAAPDVDALLRKCVRWDYFVKEKVDDQSNSPDDGDDFLYSMGPRSALEIGRKQIIQFCASVLGEEPDPSMLREVEGDTDDDDDDDDEVSSVESS